MAKDYYEILGIDRQADADEIKKAYRKRALKFHPDRNPGDKEAENQFKELSEAYEVLGDPSKRSMYDQVGHQAFKQRSRPGTGGGGGFTDPFDLFSQVFGDASMGSIFEQMFGGGRQSRGGGQQSGADLRYDLRIAFEDAVYGAEKQVQVQKPETCEDCNGSGAADGKSGRKCDYCGGAGQVSITQGFFNVRQPCPRCRGEGMVIDKPCGGCEGSGRVTKTKVIQIRIPAGVDTGARLRVGGEGEAGARGGPAGDLYVILHVDEHEIFKREDSDIVVEVPIDFPTAALGGTIKVPTISGLANLKIPAGTQHGAVFRLRGKGIPSLRGHGRGDQHVVISLETPRGMSRGQRDKLKEFADEVDEKVYPKLTAFREKIKRAFDK